MVLVIRRDGLVWSRVHLERLEPPQEAPSGCNIATHESEFDIAVHVLAYERPFRVKLNHNLISLPPLIERRDGSMRRHCWWREWHATALRSGEPIAPAPKFWSGAEVIPCWVSNGERPHSCYRGPSPVILELAHHCRHLQLQNCPHDFSEAVLREGRRFVFRSRPLSRAFALWMVPSDHVPSCSPTAKLTAGRMWMSILID